MGNPCCTSHHTGPEVLLFSVEAMRLKGGTFKSQLATKSRNNHPDYGFECSALYVTKDQSEIEVVVFNK